MGVDHAGHRFGPAHPAMARKLADVDRLLNETVALLQEGDVLVVVGDHGMTPTGDHGGDSVLETHAALFVYAPGKPFETAAFALPTAFDVPTAVHQTDLVPTLSLLLGAAVPYVSLGAPLAPLFGSVSAALQANRQAAHQVARFFRTYNTEPGVTASTAIWPSGEQAAALAALLATADVLALDGSDLPAALKAYAAYLAAARRVAESAWTTFDLSAMVLGLMLLFAAGVAASAGPETRLSPLSAAVSR